MGFSSVKVAEWPPFGKELLIRLPVCFHFIVSICNFGCFEGESVVLIAPVPDH